MAASPARPQDVVCGHGRRSDCDSALEASVCTQRGQCRRRGATQHVAVGQRRRSAVTKKRLFPLTTNLRMLYWQIRCLRVRRRRRLPVGRIVAARHFFDRHVTDLAGTLGITGPCLPVTMSVLLGTDASGKAGHDRRRLWSVIVLCGLHALMGVRAGRHSLKPLEGAKLL